MNLWLESNVYNLKHLQWTFSDAQCLVQLGNIDIIFQYFDMECYQKRWSLTFSKVEGWSSQRYLKWLFHGGFRVFKIVEMIANDEKHHIM